MRVMYFTFKCAFKYANLVFRAKETVSDGLKLSIQ